MKTRFASLFALALVLGLVGVVGAFATPKSTPTKFVAKKSCCFEGSACCFDGSPCCEGVADCCFPGSACCFAGSPCCEAGACCSVKKACCSAPSACCAESVKKTEPVVVKKKGCCSGN